GACNASVPATCWAQLQARTFMHELGHSLGLQHGGLDEVNYKPNHFSVMNYMYQVYRNKNPIPLDYGRVATTLDETSLDETVGIPKTGLSPADLAQLSR